MGRHRGPEPPDVPQPAPAAACPGQCLQPSDPSGRPSAHEQRLRRFSLPHAPAHSALGALTSITAVASAGLSPHGPAALVLRGEPGSSYSHPVRPWPECPAPTPSEGPHPTPTSALPAAWKTLPQTGGPPWAFPAPPPEPRAHPIAPSCAVSSPGCAPTKQTIPLMRWFQPFILPLAPLKHTHYRRPVSHRGRDPASIAAAASRPNTRPGTQLGSPATE